ncbi:ATP-binding cassette domain-containing protein [Actinoplanes sp. NPDC051411]|uniref:ATP-binding cassette domain-containing protein n=1 Tax=Actinoplanes sp. NPDC051411 TaxID=3155522 RepID=UPI00341BE820
MSQTSSDAIPDPVLRASGLTKRYGSRQVLHGIDLTVRRGEVYGFLGPNGAGKTTTLRIILGLVRLTAGRVRVLDGSPGSPSVLRRIGMLIESPAFYPYLSGRDNLRALARYRRLPDSRVDEVLDFVELTSSGRARFAGYSLGMKQRLGLAAALLPDPPLLILDEPTNGLDPAGIAKMRGSLRRLSDAGHTILLSSHLLGEVQQVCDRVGMIAAGRMVREGTVDELRGGRRLTVAARPLEQAREVAGRVLGTDRVSVVDGQLSLLAGDNDASRVNRALVTAGVDVSGLSWQERSLEDIFFEVTQEPALEPAGERKGTS